MNLGEEMFNPAKFGNRLHDEDDFKEYDCV